MALFPLLAHHVEINLFDLIVIEPETMVDHAAIAAVAAVIVGFLVYGMRAAVRDVSAWRSQRRRCPQASGTASVAG